MHYLTPHIQTHQILKLNTHQLKTLGMLADRHENEVANIYQHSKTKVVTVEFIFPTAYIIATDGRAIPQ